MRSRRSMLRCLPHPRLSSETPGDASTSFLDFLGGLLDVDIHLGYGNVPGPSARVLASTADQLKPTKLSTWAGRDFIGGPKQSAPSRSKPRPFSSSVIPRWLRQAGAEQREHHWLKFRDLSRTGNHGLFHGGSSFAWAECASPADATGARLRSREVGERDLFVAVSARETRAGEP